MERIALSFDVEPDRRDARDTRKLYRREPKAKPWFSEHAETAHSI